MSRVAPVDDKRLANPERSNNHRDADAFDDAPVGFATGFSGGPALMISRRCELRVDGQPRAALANVASIQRVHVLQRLRIGFA